MFESSDPGPFAVDDGRILGIRIEVFSQSLYPLCCTNLPDTTNEARPIIKKPAPFGSHIIFLWLAQILPPHCYLFTSTMFPPAYLSSP